MTAWELRSPRTVVFAVVLVALAALPAFATEFFVDNVMTQVMILGLAAATIVFLTRYAGMISLAQLLFAGTAGFMFGNAALESGARGLNLGWNPWVSVVFALAVTTGLALLLGALGSRTTGIYFLMLTLVYAVIGYNFFAQVVPVSGPGGVTSIIAPSPFDDSLWLYWLSVILSAVGYVVLRAVGRTNFGLALQGVRDDPVRMASLGFNVQTHRTLAFALAGFIAGIAGLLNVWFNGQIDPASIGIGPTLVLLIIAVIGGISYFEGAWLGAFVYVGASIYLRELPLVDQIGLTADRFNTVIGLIVLLIMVLSPEGLVGILEKLRGWRTGSSSAEAGMVPTAEGDASGRAPPGTPDEDKSAAGDRRSDEQMEGTT